MDTSNQNQGQPPVAPQAQQLPDASAAAAMPPIDAGANLNGNGNAIPQLPDHLLGSMNAEAMAGMMPDPSLMADPTMLAAAMQMPLADPSAFMMQPGMAMLNGQPHAFGVPVAPPPATVSAGKSRTSNLIYASSNMFR